MEMMHVIMSLDTHKNPFIPPLEPGSDEIDLTEEPPRKRRRTADQETSDKMDKSDPIDLVKEEVAVPQRVCLRNEIRRLKQEQRQRDCEMTSLKIEWRTARNEMDRFRVINNRMVKKTMVMRAANDNMRTELNRVSLQMKREIAEKIRAVVNTETMTGVITRQHAELIQMKGLNNKLKKQIASLITSQSENEKEEFQKQSAINMALKLDRTNDELQSVKALCRRRTKQNAELQQRIKELEQKITVQDQAIL